MATKLFGDLNPQPTLTYLANYIKAGGDEQARVQVLLAGTMIFRHVLNHPRYGKSLLPYVIKSFAALAPILDEIKNGELLTWSEQEKLST